MVRLFIRRRCMVSVQRVGLCFWVCCCCAMSPVAVYAQAKPYDLWWVQFTDKQGTPYSVWQPQYYLSARAIARREAQGIEVDSIDLPVSPTYTAAVQRLGAEIHHTSRWLNGAIAYTRDSTVVAAMQRLPFVAKVEPIGIKRKIAKPKPSKPNPNTEYKRQGHPVYGRALRQIEMLGGVELHQAGYRGQGVWVAVLDGGFKSVDVMPVFDSLRQAGRLLGTRDFVQGDDYVYESSTHGSQVLSNMAACLPGLMVGTAPDASYLLLKTEDVDAELIMEEYFWACAAEYADSIGVDVLNSSLGYSRFDDERMDHTYSDLNGRTAPASRAASIAAAKGIAVVNSAGNSGYDPWRYIGAPADAEGILAVAATDARGGRAYFSSYGHPDNPVLKPDIAAMGENTVVAAASSSYRVTTADGTSFASPISAGMVASLRSAVPSTTSTSQLLHAIRQSGHQAAAPDRSLGYGLPDYHRAYAMLSPKLQPLLADQTVILQTQADQLSLYHVPTSSAEAVVECVVINTLGNEVARYRYLPPKKGATQYLTVDDGSLPNGHYQVLLRLGNRVQRAQYNKQYQPAQPRKRA